MSTLEDIIDLAYSRSGSVIGTLLSPTGERLADIGTVDGRIWRVEIERSDVAPLSARISQATKGEAANAQRNGLGTESLSRAALSEIQREHLNVVVDGLMALDLIVRTTPDAVWDFRPTSQPTRVGRIRGHHIAAISAALREKGIDIMTTNIERVIAQQQAMVPECVARARHGN